MIELHNLKIEKTICTTANPFSKYRDDIVLTKRLENLSVSDGATAAASYGGAVGVTDVLVSPTSAVSLTNTSDTYGTLTCCGVTYKQEGRFLTHRRKKHGDETLVCKVCQTKFNTQKALACHEKSHKN